MQEKKPKIILWTYLGLMVCFILLVSFGGEEKTHAPPGETAMTTETHATAAPETALAEQDTQHQTAATQEAVKEPAQEDTHVAAAPQEKQEPHGASHPTEKTTPTTHALDQTAHPATDPFEGKPTPDEAIALLKKGNQRFVHGESTHPHLNLARLIQAGSENQGDHAYATVITCSDSRIPLEAIFDAAIMNIFVIRVAGNVCDVDERGSIEYGLAHVNTPVLVVLGHTQCGAVTAVTQAVLGHGHKLERNIPALVDNIIPAVKKAMADHPEIKGTDIIPMAIEENIWTGIEELFMESPATRNLVAAGKVKVVGAIYDVGEGSVEWLPEEKSMEILKKVEANPNKAVVK
jgi:carbonic anhydrase